MSTAEPAFTWQSPRLATFHGSLNEAFVAGDPLSDSKHAEQLLVSKVHGLYSALGRGDIDAFMDFFSLDVVVDVFAPPAFCLRSHAEGRVEARALILHNFALIEAQQPQITCVVAQGDTVVVWLQEEGFVRQTGLGYVVQAVQRFTFNKEGLIWGFGEVVALCP